MSSFRLRGDISGRSTNVKATGIIVPTIGLSDGIIDSLYTQKMNTPGHTTDSINRIKGSDIRMDNFICTRAFFITSSFFMYKNDSSEDKYVLTV